MKQKCSLENQLEDVANENDKWARSNITKTYPYNFDPLKSHFYIVKLGFTGVYIIFLISAQKRRLWVLVRTSTHNLCFWPEIVKNIRIFIRKPIFFFGGEIFNIYE